MSCLSPQVRKVEFGKGGVPYVITHDGRTIRYPDPEIKVGGEQDGNGSCGGMTSAGEAEAPALGLQRKWACTVWK